MTPTQSHALKLKMSVFAEATAMLEYAKTRGQAELDLALTTRDQARKDVFDMIDEMTEE